MKSKLLISPSQITNLLFIIVGFLLFSDLLAIYFKHIKGWENALGFNRLFDFDSELNFPSLYSSLAIVFCGGLLLFIANNNSVPKGDRIYWKGLAGIFFFLGLDELISIHEKFSILMGMFFSELTEATGNKVWFIPFGLIFLFVALFFVKFLLRLPKKTLAAFVVAGTVFVTGAVFVELISGIFLANNPSGLGYSLLYSLEELLEMTGIILFIRALTTYIVTYCQGLDINVEISFIENTHKVSETAPEFKVSESFSMENTPAYSNRNG